MCVYEERYRQREREREREREADRDRERIITARVITLTIIKE